MLINPHISQFSTKLHEDGHTGFVVAIAMEMKFEAIAHNNVSKRSIKSHTNILDAVNTVYDYSEISAKTIVVPPSNINPDDLNPPPVGGH